MKITVGDTCIPIAIIVIILDVILCILLMANVITNVYWSYTTMALSGFLMGMVFEFLSDFIIDI